MGEAARQRVIQEFTQKPIRILEDLYTSLLMPRNQNYQTGNARA